ncbi:MAG: hypothetical protein AB1592_11430 [Pseudomonadota bacterium]
MKFNDLPGDAQHAVQLMLPQLLIALVQRAGGEVRVPVADIDGTGGVNLMMEHDLVNRAFVFRVVPKAGQHNG